MQNHLSLVKVIPDGSAFTGDHVVIQWHHSHALLHGYYVLAPYHNVYTVARSV